MKDDLELEQAADDILRRIRMGAVITYELDEHPSFGCSKDVLPDVSLDAKDEDDVSVINDVLAHLATFYCEACAAVSDTRRGPLNVRAWVAGIQHDPNGAPF